VRSVTSGKFGFYQSSQRIRSHMRNSFRPGIRVLGWVDWWKQPWHKSPFKGLLDTSLYLTPFPLNWSELFQNSMKSAFCTLLPVHVMEFYVVWILFYCTNLPKSDSVAFSGRKVKYLYLLLSCLKGQSQEIFDPRFFSLNGTLGGGGFMGQSSFEFRFAFAEKFYSSRFFLLDNSKLKILFYCHGAGKITYDRFFARLLR
jgi:hypothetical protein